MSKTRRKIHGRSFWSGRIGTLTADQDLGVILGSTIHLALRYWKEGMFFHGGEDSTLFNLTEGRFPAKVSPGKAHPIYSLRAVPDAIGFKVCPCSSKRPFDAVMTRYIEKDCRLQYTGYVMDRRSFLIEGVEFNIPASIAPRLRFKGVVPVACLKTTGSEQ